MTHAQPKITKQPTDQFVDLGKNVQLNFAASGTSPYTNRWFFNGVALANATNLYLLFTNAQPSLNGDYFAVRSDASGSVTSQVARLKVFVSAPHGFSTLAISPGEPATLSFRGETIAPFGPYYDLYPLETSSNLLDWIPLVLLQRSNSALATLEFVDTNAPDFEHRFYRLATNEFVTPLPPPTRPSSVGTFSLLLTDPSRTNTVRHTNQQFMVTFWYPAVAQAGVTPGPYLEKQVAQSGYFNLSSAGGGNFSSQVAAFFSHSLSNAPQAADLAKYPVILYSPGYQGHRRENSDKVEELASQGHIVVGLDHRDTVLSVAPDGTILRGQPGDTSSTKGIVAIIENRLLDEQFVLNQLVVWNSLDPILAGRLDLDRIGAFGWSLGGATAAQLCLRDPRCKAGAGFDGTFFETNLLTQTMPVPYLFFRSGDGPDLVPGDDTWMVYSHFVTNAYWIKLTSTVHGSFSNWDLIANSLSLAAGWGTPTSGQFLSPPRLTQIVRSYLLSFFNKYLKERDDHLLDGPSADYPEIVKFVKK